MTRLCQMVVLAIVSISVSVPMLPARAAAAAPTCDGRAATLVGTSGPDRLTGTSGGDVIVGLGGHDVIHGAGGSDIICGGSGHDRIDDGSGDDWLSGGPGGDVIDTEGGPGETVLGRRGDDSILVAGDYDTSQGPPALGKVKAGPGRDHVLITIARTLTPSDAVSGGPGHDEINLFTAGRPSGPVTANLDAGTLSEASQVMSLAGFADITLYTHGSPKLTLIGDSRPNLLDVVPHGRSRPDALLRGLGGEDVLLGGRGDDRLEGGLGRDRGDGYGGQNTCVSVESRRHCTVAGHHS
jgi:Ca2+-binding RTX toxin-like protein